MNNLDSRIAEIQRVMGDDSYYTKQRTSLDHEMDEAKRRFEDLMNGLERRSEVLEVMRNDGERLIRTLRSKISHREKQEDVLKKQEKLRKLRREILELEAQCANVQTNG